MPEPEYRVCLKMKELSKRGQAISRILKPIISSSNRIQVHHTQRASDEFIWLALASGENTQGDYTQKKFPITETFQASYHERWQRNYSGREEYWYLERAYLHFYELNPETTDYDEYLLLHCDPNENREHALYKQSPHLHIEFAPEPWPKAHIALNVGYLKEMLTDADALTNVFKDLVVMLKDQVIQHL